LENRSKFPELEFWKFEFWGNIGTKTRLQLTLIRGIIYPTIKSKGKLPTLPYLALF
jgi:hypothetical protein